jgi:hypothetical protein
MDMTLFSILFLFVGLIGGWFIADKYNELRDAHEHDFEELFEKNPHPEIYDENGKIDRGEYSVINFELGYDPEEWDPEDIH